MKTIQFSLAPFIVYKDLFTTLLLLVSLAIGCKVQQGLKLKKKIHFWEQDTEI